MAFHRLRVLLNRPALDTRIADEGHLLGNHSATHPLLDQTYVDDPDLLLDQLRDVDDQITPLMPADTKFYFRAPYGAWRPELRAAGVIATWRPTGPSAWSRWSRRIQPI